MSIYDVDDVNYDYTRAMIISGLSFYRSEIHFNSVNELDKSEKEGEVV